MYIVTGADLVNTVIALAGFGFLSSAFVATATMAHLAGYRGGMEPAVIDGHRGRLSN